MSLAFGEFLFPVFYLFAICSCNYVNPASYIQKDEARGASKGANAGDDWRETLHRAKLADKAGRKNDTNTSSFDLDLDLCAHSYKALIPPPRRHHSLSLYKKSENIIENEMKLDLSSLPTARGLADALAEIAPLHFAAGAVLVFGAGRLIPDFSANYKEWYPSLAKPSWNPPGYVFPMVWIPLKLLQSAALAVVGKVAVADVKNGGTSSVGDVFKSVTSSKAVGALAVFAGMTALGNYWNVTFFGRRQMKKSVKVMAAFWGSVAATIAAFGAVDKIAGALVAPTLVWVTIATALNATVVKLNPGKGAKED